MRLHTLQSVLSVLLLTGGLFACGDLSGLCGYLFFQPSTLNLTRLLRPQVIRAPVLYHSLDRLAIRHFVRQHFARKRRNLRVARKS
jgi:hypothetical protein